jgi:hypothetical protein
MPRLTPADLYGFRATMCAGDQLGSDLVRRLAG